MATSEMTWAEDKLNHHVQPTADLTEKDRLVDTRPEVSRREPIERIASVPARGRIIKFKYLDNGDPLPDWFIPVLQGFANVLTLRDNWDGEGAAEIDRSAVNQALAAIDQLLDRRDASPDHRADP